MRPCQQSISYIVVPLGDQIVVALSWPPCPDQSPEYIASFYAELRQMEKAALGAAATYTTPRTLLSILRLSQALAKLRFSNLVEQVRQHVY